MGRPTDLPLAPYRALDLTEGGYNWCGKVLADLGADVIKVEPPQGSPTRLRAPFYKDQPHPDGGLFWRAYCLNKRSITLDLEDLKGREVFKRLAATSDFVLESFRPGYLDGLGLGYAGLSRINPGVILTSMTPFGQRGPYAQYKATDIVAWSMGGMQYVTGDPDRPPVRVPVPQAELHAGAQGTIGSLIALWHRHNTGLGQQVDVSTQVAVIWTLMDATPFPPLQRENVERWGGHHKWKSFVVRAVFPCKDGHVSATIWEGATMRALIRWMDEEGVTPELLKGRGDDDWDVTDFASRGEEGAEELLAIEKQVCDFFANKTKAQLYERAISHRMLLAPCGTQEDVSDSIQLKARGFWLRLPNPGPDGSLAYPGPYIKLSETPIAFRRPPPGIGEHNEEIYKELGLRAEQLRHPSRISHSTRGADNRVEVGAENVLPNPVRGGSAAGSMALEGIKVLDFTWIAVGPITIKYLADHGATVVRVESLTRPDGLRRAPPFKDAEEGINRSQFPANFNTNKYGLGLNMSKPEARELIRRLIREWQPDVIAESFTPRVMRAWGLDYKRVGELKPDIIYFSACQQGQTGPHSRFAGYGMQSAALAGFYQITGWPDREPSLPYGAYADFINPPNGAAAILAALDYRRRTGKGQHLDMAQFECAVHYLAPAIMDFQVNGRALNRRGNRDDTYAPHGVYPCKESNDILNGVEVSRTGGQWCAISVTTGDEWYALCKAMGDPSWTKEARFSTFSGRRENQEELDGLVGRWTARHEARKLMEALQGAGVPAGVVQSQSDLWRDPQLKHLGYFQWLDHTECGPMPYDGLQFQLSRSPGKLQRPQALIGEHNQLILKEFIGLTDKEIAALVEAEALETS